METETTNQIQTEDTNQGVNKPKMYTEEEVAKMIQSEADRRVQSAIATRDKNLNEKFDIERQEWSNQKLSAEEKIANLEKAMLEMKNEKLISDNRLKLERLFNESGLSGDNVVSILDNIVTTDFECSNKIANSILAIISGEKGRLQGEYDQKISSVPKPTNNGETTLTQEQFNKMPVDEQIKFIGDNKELATKYLGI